MSYTKTMITIILLM